MQFPGSTWRISGAVVSVALRARASTKALAPPGPETSTAATLNVRTWLPAGHGAPGLLPAEASWVPLDTRTANGVPSTRARPAIARRAARGEPRHAEVAGRPRGSRDTRKAHTRPTATRVPAN